MTDTRGKGRAAMSKVWYRALTFGHRLTEFIQGYEESFDDQDDSDEPKPRKKSSKGKGKAKGSLSRLYLHQV